MVSGRPLLYLSLPGVAFILGVFWFRRRNKNRNDNSEIRKLDKNKEASENSITKSHYPKTHSIARENSSKSMNINGKSQSSEDENQATKLFGKSAPIQIVQNGRCSPVKPQMQCIDSEVLKTKIQDAESKVLRSIDEDLENISSVDLPDSYDNRVSFHARKNIEKKDEPIVIRATKTPKISPENLFSVGNPAKNDDEQNNNCESTQICSTKIEENNAEKVRNTNEEETCSEKRNKNVASPSLSLCSVQSGDSGTGSSLPRSEANRARTSYEFFFPTSLIGHLYGRKRSFLNQIMGKTSANILLRKNPFSGKVKICVIEGTEAEINAALLMIRHRLPIQRYPNFTMQRIHFAVPQTIVPLSSENMLNLKLNLIEGINNDVVVSAVISGGQIFVQHPLHPSHPSLAVLQKSLYDCYTTIDAPHLPRIELSAVCVLPVNGIWYRVQIVEKDAEDDQKCTVIFLDFGGYMNVHLNDLRQIRSGFMSIPFQATECMISNIEPIESSWTPEAADILCSLTKGIVLQAQVAGYNHLNIPEVYLFACLGPNNVIFINKELVARNLAKWID